MTETYCAEETFALGKRIGEHIGPGTVISLMGDLGVGKTVFTQGVAAGLGILEPGTAPGRRLPDYDREGHGERL